MKNNTSTNAIDYLCSTCNHLDHCTYHRDFKGAIFLCEDFDNAVPVLEPVEEHADDRAPVLYSSLKGLCMNCGLAGTCHIPKTETGIWFCDDYK